MRKKEAEYSTAARSAGSDDIRPDKQKLERARPKNETASNIRSNDIRPVLPRGSVLLKSGTKLAAMASRSVAVQTEDPPAGRSPCPERHEV